jgi:anti-anti-sigma factor
MYRERNDAHIGNEASVPVIETVVTSENRVRCRPIGDLDWVGAVYLRDAVAGILQPGVDLVIDFSMVDFVDTDGIVALRNSMELVRLVGGDTRFCGMTPQVSDILGFARLDAGYMVSAQLRPSARR